MLMKIIEAENSTETSVTIYQIIRRHIPENLNIPLRFVFLLIWGVQFMRIIARKNSLRLEEMIIMTMMIIIITIIINT
jgi:hypothetical protein